MAYIKSHSNYVLKKKHQRIDNGVIFERDYTTIGGKDNFAPNQIPIYRSGNFIITTHDEYIPRKQHANQLWEENENGTVWNYGDVENASSKTEYSDNQIVLKNDYLQLSDFAYYGSCTELVRGSINGIISKFPGELYVSKQRLSEIGYEQSSLNNAYYVENPFDIDIYTTWVAQETDETKLKYLAANEHWFNYDIIDANGDIVSSAFTVEVQLQDNHCNQGEIDYAEARNLPVPERIYNDGAIVYTVKFESYLTIYCVKYNKKLLYFTNSNVVGYHIRPKEKFLLDFYDNLDSFQSIILNPKSDPKYTVSFEILSEGEYGYNSSIESFTFPMGNGGYNVGADTNSLNMYVSRFLSFTEYYDQHFSDNLYRMMTHDSIKNFDWTYTVPNQQSEEWAENGDKIAQLIRLFGREFDEIKFYIDGLTHCNNITYDDRNNIPDYFLTDALETDGWDLKSICPLVLNEYINYCDTTTGKIYKLYREKDENCFTNTFKDDNQTVSVSSVSEPDNVADNYILNRIFSHDINSVVYPYMDRFIFPNGYFNICNGGDDSCSDYKYGKQEAEKGQKLYVETVGDRKILRKRVKKYSSEKAYSFKDINTMFLKRLKLNSRHILRHKGTIQGLEMAFGMMGMVSKNFVEQYSNIYNKESAFTDSFPISINDWDYDIKEYTTFSNPILDPYYACKDITRIDWYNSTKTIPYNTVDYKNGIYTNYQGLPIAFRDVYYEIEKTQDGYTLKDSIDADVKEVISYNTDKYILNYFNNEDEPQQKLAYRYRNIYPYFDSEAIYDGNPYYQMNGGWFSNYPYMFDKNNNIVSLTDELEDSNKDALYTETIDKLKIVENMQQLVDLPMYDLTDGDIYKVNDTSGEFLLVDGYLYKVLKDFKNNRYINVIKSNDVVDLGYRTFTDMLYVSNVYGDCDVDNMETYSTSGNSGISMHDLSQIQNGEAIRIYLLFENGEFDKIVAQDHLPTEDSEIGFELQYVDDGIFTTESGTVITNLFKIIDKSGKLRFNGNGWKQLYEDDFDYIKSNIMQNYFKGNNPHTGNMQYDNGFTYAAYFANLFNYSYNNNLFDNRKYDGNFDDEIEYIGNIGFKSLVEDEIQKKYRLYEDSKVHFFGNSFDFSDENSDDNLERNEEHMFDVRTADSWYDKADYNDAISDATTACTSCTIQDIDDVIICSGVTPDGSTAQIMNTKVMEITIKLNAKDDCSLGMYSKGIIEEMKYMQDVVLPFVLQTVPSSTILKVKYQV